MLALCLFIKTLLGVCLRKRLDQARNVYIQVYCCDTWPQVSATYFAAFLTNQKKNVLQYFTEKIIASMGKFMLPRKMFKSTLMQI